MVLLYNAQTQTSPTDHPRHDQPGACSPQATQPAYQYTVPCRVKRIQPVPIRRRANCQVARGSRASPRACLSGQHNQPYPTYAGKRPSHPCLQRPLSWRSCGHHPHPHPLLKSVFGCVCVVSCRVCVRVHWHRRAASINPSGGGQKTKKKTRTPAHTRTRTRTHG